VSSGNVLPYSNKTQVYNQAINYYNKALALDPNNTAAMTNKGIVLIKLAKYDGALKLFDKVLNISSDNAPALFYKGTALDKLGIHNIAIKYYSNAHSVDPNYKGDFVNLVSKSLSLATSHSIAKPSRHDIEVNGETSNNTKNNIAKQ
jgi:tetratricopeptide (TPR) repeat protein